MRRTNRALNRMLLAILGIILVGAGAALIAAGTLPGVADAWAGIGANLTDQIRNLASTAPLPEPARTWWLIAGIVVLLLGAGLSTAWLASQGGGRTPRLAEKSEGADGRTVVDVGLISAAVQEALSGNRNVLATSVSAWESRRGTALRLRMEARHGSSPRELADTAEQLVRQIDSWLGHPLPVLVRITSGARTRTSGSQRAK
ncbi:hypothetical protein [Paenarthrobacter nitroguajacolicus]|uniref:hypothetical protein n=1 Tax=Paenarthrobacter nitroguajacolicus TaxID=211146 RepID=UPI002866FED8|nr:hypothetical protein [Paenarthrobacter nitroguajacolicus]MDR6638402.1 hypothetical protein [Paenarthrobacter nitroguajacolicus]